MHKKLDWNKRLKREVEKDKKKIKVPFLINNVKIEEVLDESGEVDEDTIIKFSFDGILIHMSIANAIKMNKLLGDVLDFKR
jgi:hypothetical protein